MIAVVASPGSDLLPPQEDDSPLDSSFPQAPNNQA